MDKIRRLPQFFFLNQPLDMLHTSSEVFILVCYLTSSDFLEVNDLNDNILLETLGDNLLVVL